MKDNKKGNNKITGLLLTLMSILLIAYITLIRRNVTSLTRKMDLTPFWSYIELIKGNTGTGLQILENILLFIPLGCSFSLVCKKKSTSVLGCLFISVLVEVLQYSLKLGLCEFDDVFNNTLGGAIGVLLCHCNRVSLKFKYSLVICLIAAGGMTCFTVKITDGTPLPQQFEFQIEDTEDGIKGFCFVYEDPTIDFNIILHADSGDIRLDTTTQIAREDVAVYFFCDKDYSHTGFAAEGQWNPDELYEIYIELMDGTKFTTGQFIRDSSVLYSKNTAPDFPGILLVSRPDYGFFVYQDGKDLYWLADNNAIFEENGTTYIQYQLWTTQTDKLPIKRLEKHCYWDNIGFLFETNEVERFEGYRVSKTALPDEYSITAIVTGYHRDGKWIWKEFFRPVLCGVFF